MIVKSNFVAPWWCKNKHLQTILPRLFMGTPKLPLQWQEIETRDGDFIELAWHQQPADCKGLVVLFHGLEGSVESHYASDFMHYLHRKGWWSVMVHFRGCGRKANRLPRSYHSGDTDDAKAVLAMLRQQHPDLTIVGMGFSLGANMLLKLLGEVKEQAWINKAIAISPPFDLQECSQSINKGFSRLYQWFLVRSMKRRFQVKLFKHGLDKKLGVNKKVLESFRSFYQFDNAITAPLHGFKSALSYYQECSASRFLKRIQTNTLVLHAVDDPFMHPGIVPGSEKLSPQVRIELSETGGHVGFLHGSVLRPRKWLHDRVLRYLEQE